MNINCSCNFNKGNALDFLYTSCVAHAQQLTLHIPTRMEYLIPVNNISITAGMTSMRLNFDPCSPKMTFYISVYVRAATTNACWKRNV